MLSAMFISVSRPSAVLLQPPSQCYHQSVTSTIATMTTPTIDNCHYENKTNIDNCHRDGH